MLIIRVLVPLFWCASQLAGQGTQAEQTQVGSAIADTTESTDTPVTLAQINAKIDSAWVPIQELIRTVEYPHGKDPVTLDSFDKGARRMRELGLAFWEKHPGDIRNLWWLQRTLTYTPLYFRNGVESASEFVASGQIRPDTSLIDVAAERVWDNRFPGIRDSILNRMAETRIGFDMALIRRGYQHLQDRKRKGKAIDPGELAQLQKDALANIRAGNRAQTSAYRIQPIFMALNIASLIPTDSARIAFARAIAGTGSATAQFIGDGLVRQIALRNNPMRMQFVALDGGKIDLAKMPAKVVLIDFWSTSCKACIAAFPTLKKLRDKYQARGFEIIGVALDPERNRQQVKKLLQRHQVTWPQQFTGDVGANEYAQKYGIKGVPVTLLLDADRKLITDDHLQFEKELEKRLAETGA